MTDLTEAPPPSIAKAQMTPGGPIAALVPQSLDDAFRLSKALSMSGDMVPKHFQEKPEAIMAAIVRGMEIGLAPMQALSNIAVINGRASIWGDAVPALLQRAGHSIDCILEGEGENLRAVATLIRGDTGKEIVRTFSVADAKKANLWGKAGPWQTYPTRMLQMRARAYAARDGAADALMGLQVAEEVSDYAPVKDVTPKEGGFSKLAQQARKAPEAPAVPEAEVLPSEPDKTAHWTDAAPDDGFPGSDAFTEGSNAFKDHIPARECPYAEGTQEAADWLLGYLGARKAAE